MAHTVTPYVVLIAKSQVIKSGIQNWLERVGVANGPIQNILSPSKSDAEQIIEVSGRRCYMAFQPLLNPNVTKIRKDITEYITNLLDKRDGSVLEHVTFTFAIEHVSRVFTGEMNRHRAGMSISEGSMRYIRYTDIPYWIPTSIQKDETEFSDPLDRGVQHSAGYYYKEAASRAVMQRVFEYVQKEYGILQEIWKEELAPASTFKKKKDITSMMRRIIPMGVSSGGVWTGNLRALRHIFEMRCSSFAEEEILFVATAMLNEMRNQLPNVFADFNTDDYGFSKPKYSKV